jgi:uncharacterized protein
MPLRESAPIGAPVWIDLFTSDPDKTRTFYGELLGWKSEEPNAEFGGYFNFTKDDQLVAGGMRNDGSAGTPDLWTVYLAVKNAEATTAAVGAHGGTVDSPAMAVGELGTMAILTDAGGAHLGLWQPGLHKGIGVVNENGAPSWFELHTRAYDASVSFYRDVFGWDPHTHSDSPEFRYTTFGGDGAEVAGIMDAAAFLPEGAPSYWSVYFQVDNTDAALEQVVALGGSVVEPAQDTPYGRLAAATDSTGAQFKLMAQI